MGKGQAAVGKCQVVVLRTLLAQVCAPDVRFVKAPSVRFVRRETAFIDGDYVFLQMMHLSGFVGFLSGFVVFLSGLVAFLSGFGGVMFVHTNT